MGSPQSQPPYLLQVSIKLQNPYVSLAFFSHFLISLLQMLGRYFNFQLGLNVHILFFGRNCWWNCVQCDICSSEEAVVTEVYHQRRYTSFTDLTFFSVSLFLPVIHTCRLDIALCNFVVNGLDGISIFQQFLAVPS